MNSSQICIPDRVDEFFRKAPSGRRRLLALTYWFGSRAFEARFGRLLGKAIQVDVVIGKDIEDLPDSADYRIWRANWPGTFHPKILVMLANEQVEVGLGSANLTTGGLGENLETWAFFGGHNGLPVLTGVRRFLEQLRKENVLLGAVNVEEFIKALPEDGASALLSTVDGRLFDQVCKRLRGSVRQLDIVSPLNCDPTSVIAAFRTVYPTQGFHLYTDAKQVARIEGVDKYWTLDRPADTDGDEPLRVLSQVHAKIYAFHQSDLVDVFWGSANLSYSAWLAKGRAANIDLLVHSRVKRKEWQQLRDKKLPQGHSWKPEKPRPIAPPEDDEREDKEWRLLHGIVENSQLTLEATGSGSKILRLRLPGRGSSLKARLDFSKGCATLNDATGRRLGIASSLPPKKLEWCFESDRRWRTIPVNVLDVVPGAEGEQEAASILFWKYAGRPLPQAARVGTVHSNAGSMTERSTHEEKELTLSRYQGKLDQVVLTWRLIARQIAQTSRGNEQLWRHRIKQALQLIEKEAKARPEAWPSYHIAFVRGLLERRWPESKQSSSGGVTK